MMKKSFYTIPFIAVITLLACNTAFAKKAAVPVLLQSSDESHLDDEMEIIMSEGKELSSETKASLNKVAKAPVKKKKISPADEVIIERGVRSAPPPSGMQVGSEAKDDDDEDVLTSDLPNIALSISSDKVDYTEEGLLVQGYHALMLGQLEAATVLYKKVLKLDKNNHSAIFALATIYQRSGQDKEAKTLYAKILTKDPLNQEALNNFLVLVGEEAPEGAIVELKKLEAVTPTFSPLSAQIGMIYAKMGDNKKAARYLNKAMLLSPENISYRYNLAILFDRMGQSEQAMMLYKELIEASNNGVILPDSSNKIKERLIFLGAQ